MDDPIGTRPSTQQQGEQEAKFLETLMIKSNTKKDYSDSWTLLRYSLPFLLFTGTTLVALIAYWFYFGSAPFYSYFGVSPEGSSPLLTACQRTVQHVVFGCFILPLHVMKSIFTEPLRFDVREVVVLTTSMLPPAFLITVLVTGYSGWIKRSARLAKVAYLSSACFILSGFVATKLVVAMQP